MSARSRVVADGGRRARMRVRAFLRGPRAIALATILFVLAVTYYGFHGGLPFRHGFRLHALMTDANNVRPKSPVRIAGVTVGRVIHVGSGSGNTTQVDMDLTDTALPIHADATVRARPRLFVEGGFYVALSPGSPSAAELHDGATLQSSQARSAVALYQALAMFTKPTREGLRHLLHTTTGAFENGGTHALRSASGSAAPALRDLALVARASLGRQSHAISAIVGGSARISSALAADQVALAGIVSNLDTTATALASSDGALGESIGRLDAVARSAGPALRSVDAALPEAVRFSKILTPGVQQAPPLLRAVAADLTQLATLVTPAERKRVVTALRASFVDFPDMLRKLTALTNTVKPTTDCVLSHVAPLLSAQIDDGALSTHRPAWQDFAHSLVGIASTAQNFDGNGYAVRYQDGSSGQAVSTGSVTGGDTLSGLTPGSSPITGVRPQWTGRLTSADFQPAADCAAQPIPSLRAAVGAPGMSASSWTPVGGAGDGAVTGAGQAGNVLRVLGDAIGRGVR